MSYCDYDSLPKFMSEHLGKARKQYQCCECNQPIHIGQLYWRVTGKWDDLETFRQHIECRDACYTIQIFDDCICFGELRDWLSQESYAAKNHWTRQVRVLYALGKRASRMKTSDQIVKYNTMWKGRTVDCR